MGNFNLQPKVNINRIVLFVRLLSLLFSFVLVLLIQMGISSMLEEGINYVQIIILISAISIIVGMLITLRFMKTGAIITILGSIGLGISVCISSNGVIHLFPFAMAVGFVFALIPFIVGLVFLVINRYNF
jgi:hypothetical protein